jgi:hypothetical protein
MLIAGGASVIAGVAYVIAAAGANPKLGWLVFYTATGGLEFVIQAWLVSTSTGASFTVNPHSCLFRATTQQNAHIADGTGLFAHASGTFTGTVSPQGLLPRNPDGTCTVTNRRCTRWTWSSSAERCRSDLS